MYTSKKNIFSLDTKKIFFLKIFYSYSILISLINWTVWLEWLGLRKNVNKQTTTNTYKYIELLYFREWKIVITNKQNTEKNNYLYNFIVG